MGFRHRAGAGRSPAEQLQIPIDATVTVDADLHLPPRPRGLIVFAHGSGSSRHSPRNHMVAAGLRERHLATLLMDLLTPGEEQLDQRTRHLRFDIELLATRLESAAAWLESEPELADLPVGYFGASTGAGAALVAAARRPARIAAVVSRGGRPDLAGEHLALVRAPTLLIVGGSDDLVIELNRDAYERMTGQRRLEIVPGATHLFEETGALEEVTRLAGDWFAEHLRSTDDP